MELKIKVDPEDIEAVQDAYYTATTETITTNKAENLLKAMPRSIQVGLLLWGGRDTEIFYQIVCWLDVLKRNSRQ